jgi:branched-chain amino acid aminotransferase
MSGDVAEGYGANLFAVFGNRVVTPPPEADILAGITRDALIQYFKSRNNLSMAVEPIKPVRLQTADEVFLCGTGMEILPVGEIEGKQIGNGKTAGPITSETIAWYHSIVSGKSQEHALWLTEVKA